MGHLGDSPSCRRRSRVEGRGGRVRGLPPGNPRRCWFRLRTAAPSEKRGSPVPAPPTPGRRRCKHGLAVTGRRGAVVVLVLVTSGALCLGFILVLGAMMGSEQDDSGCTGSGESVLPASASKVGGLTPAQLANAGAVIAEG